MLLYRVPVVLSKRYHRHCTGNMHYSASTIGDPHCKAKTLLLREFFKRVHRRATSPSITVEKRTLPHAKPTAEVETDSAAGTPAKFGPPEGQPACIIVHCCGPPSPNTPPQEEKKKTPIALSVTENTRKKTHHGHAKNQQKPTH